MDEHPAGSSRPPSTPTDGDARSEDLERWESEVARLSSRYAPKRYDAEDIAQECRVALIRCKVSFDPSRGKFDHLARRSIQNAARNCVVRQFRRPEVLENELPSSDDGSLLRVDDWPSSNATPEEDTVASERCHRVRAIISGLPRRLQSVYDLLYVRDLDQRSAARLMGLSQARVAQLHQDLKLAVRDRYASQAA